MKTKKLLKQLYKEAARTYDLQLMFNIIALRMSLKASK